MHVVSRDGARRPREGLSPCRVDPAHSAAPAPGMRRAEDARRGPPALPALLALDCPSSAGAGPGLPPTRTWAPAVPSSSRTHWCASLSSQAREGLSQLCGSTSQLSRTCPQSPWNAPPPPRTHAREWYTCSGLSKLFLSLRWIGEGIRSGGLFQFLCFLTDKFSFLPIGQDMLFWGMWLFAGTIKIHCACWVQRPLPPWAPIPIPGPVGPSPGRRDR